MPSTALILFLAVASIYTTCQVYSAYFISSDCCLRTSDRRIPYNNVKCYKNQTRQSGCMIEAAIFVTRRNRCLCAPPDSPWVKTLMADIDRKKPQAQKDCGKPR